MKTYITTKLQCAPGEYRTNPLTGRRWETGFGVTNGEVLRNRNGIPMIFRTLKIAQEVANDLNRNAQDK